MLDTFLTKFLPMAFATNGLKNNIPVADPAMFSSASYEKGFPQSTMKKVTEGGIPPQGKDFNGILNEISSHTVWTNAGGTYKFNGELSNAIGGYAKGAVLVADNLKFAVISLVNNNKINFNTNPSSISPTGPWRLWCDSETLDTIVPDLQRRMGIAEKNITNLQGRMTTAEGNIKNLQGRMTTAEGNIKNLQGRMTSAENRITATETAITRLDDTTLTLRVDAGQDLFVLGPPNGGTGIMFCSIYIEGDGQVEYTWTFPNGGFLNPPQVSTSINYGGQTYWGGLATAQIGVNSSATQCVFGRVSLNPDFTVSPASVGIWATAFGFVNVRK